MNKKQGYALLIILIVAAAGWLVYTWFIKEKENQNASAEIKPVQQYLPNACWVYHEFVYRVDFSGLESTGPYFFVRNEDGTFSPSKADSAANNITGNGFLVDSAGACLITEKLAAPWSIDEKEKQLLKELIDEWLQIKYDADLENTNGVAAPKPGYSITGQTVAFFIIINDAKNYIEYNVSEQAPGQDGYRLAYPVRKIYLQGIGSSFTFSSVKANSRQLNMQILKSSFDENSPDNPVSKPLTDSIQSSLSEENFLDNLKILKGDDFFYEGSVLFDDKGNILGSMSYKNSKWLYHPVSALVTNTPAYSEYDPQERWMFDRLTGKWNLTYKKDQAENTSDNTSDNTNGYETNKISLDPVLKVYPSPAIQEPAKPVQLKPNN